MAGLLVVPERTPALEREAQARGFGWQELGDGYSELTGGLFRVLVAEMGVVAEAEDDDMLRLFGKNPAHTQEARRFWAELVGSKEAMMNVSELEGYDEVIQRFLAELPAEQRLAGLQGNDEVIQRFLAGLPAEQRLAGLQGNDEVIQRFLAGLPAEQRLAGLQGNDEVIQRFLAELPTEQRLAGLPPEQVVQAVGTEHLLLAMSDDVLRALSDDFVEKLPEPTRGLIRARRRGKV